MATFLQKSRHNSVFYFRRRVPEDLTSSIRKRQIYQSLQTSDRREAVVRARQLAAQTDQLFAELRSMSKNRFIRTDYVLEVKLNWQGRPELIRVEADTPKEHDAAQKALETTMNGLAALQAPASIQTIAATTGPAIVPQRGPTLGEGVEEYFNKAELKSTSRASYRTKLNFLTSKLGGDTPLFDIDQERFSSLATITAIRPRSRASD